MTRQNPLLMSHLLPKPTNLTKRAASTVTHAAAVIQPAASAAAASAHQFLLTFTPTQAAMGGLIIAIAVVGKLLLTGRVLGIGGAMRGLLTTDRSMWRFAFLAGMAAGALPLTQLAGPATFDIFPATYTITRMAVCGLLVGLGVGLGNGCTSGHGVCGNARLSPRSMLFTVMFMACGMLTAVFTDSAGALGVAVEAAGKLPPLAAASAAEMATMWKVAGGSAAALTLIGVMGAKLKQHARAMEAIAEFACGVVMSLGLGFCGMTHPAKLACFLHGPFGTVPWDPSLLFVMGTAVVVSALAYQSLAGRLGLLPPALLARPVVVEKYTIPPATAPIDTKLVLGAVLFGLGIGGSGLCPGPDIVNVCGMFTPQVAMHLGAMLAGFALEPFVSKLLFKK